MNLTTARKTHTPHESSSIHDFINPNTLQQLLKEPSANLLGPENRAAANTEVTARLTNDQGRYALSWKANIVGYWDWIGLYPNSEVPDNEQVDWTWIRNVGDGSYRTSQPVQPGSSWEARYFVWDYSSNSYRCIARGGMR